MAARSSRAKEAHIKIKTWGAPEKVELFHFVLSTLDLDWPLGPNQQYTPEELQCEKCHGYIYCNPYITPEYIRTLAKMVDACTRIPGPFKVKVKMFTKYPREGGLGCGVMLAEPDPPLLITQPNVYEAMNDMGMYL